MRYLWVEDFGDDSEDQDDKQTAWEEYFGIEDNILINTLEDALIYLDNFENRSSFDAILLDIRFPVIGDESNNDENDIYEQYFSNIITDTMFHTYADSDVMRDASSGILLFMALIFRYGYNWNNIAFISANIDDEDLSAITTLKELLTKVKYGEKLSRREKSLYKTRYSDVYSNNGIATKNLEKIENLKIVECDALSSDLDDNFFRNELKKLSTIQEKINIKAPKKEGLKYCSVRNHFERMGLKMPPAFEKPNDESLQECWLFKEWKDARCDILMITKRLVVDMCMLLMNNINGNVESFLLSQRKYNDDESVMTEENIRQYLQDIIRYVTNYPEIKTNEYINVYATTLVEKSCSLWESIKKPKVNNNVNSYCTYAYYAVMRLTRNWMAHQGIKGLDINFAVFTFLISIKGVFGFNNFSRSTLTKYKELENSLIDIFSLNPIDVKSIDIEKKMKLAYADSEKKLQMAIPKNHVGKPEIPVKFDPFALISGFGHENSCRRESVSVVELYRVFLMCLYFGDEKSDQIIFENIHSDSIINIIEGIYDYQKV